MIASALPTAQQGSSAGEGASGFRGLLAALLSSDGEDGAVSPDGRTTPRAMANPKAADGSGPLVLPGATDPKSAEPQVLPGTGPAKDAEPLVLPGAVDAKPSEPQILPGTAPGKDVEPQVLPGVLEAKVSEPLVLPGIAPGKDAGPHVLPGVVDTKASEPEVLPGTAPGKPSGPFVLPDGLTPRSPGPQVLPGMIEGKAAGPQVLPGTPPADIALPVVVDGDAMETATAGPASELARSAAGYVQPHPSQPAPPPLRALAERTSEPLDETPTAPSPSATDPKAAAPTTSPVSASADQTAKLNPQTHQAQAAPQADRSAGTPDEAPSTGGPSAGQAEATAPARDHSLSTLSRASIDATAQIAAQIQRRLEGRSTRFEIALRPAELGRVDVKLDIDAEGRLAARLAFDNPAAATDLRGRVDELRRQLEAAGFELADDAFEFAERDSGSSAFDRGQDARQGQDRAFAAAARLTTEIDVAQPPQWLSLSLSPSGVDMKV